MSRRKGHGGKWYEERRSRKKLVEEKSFSPLTNHHLTPTSQGGDENGPTIRLEESKHNAWHILVRNSLLDSAADKLSLYIPIDTKFFAVNRNSPLSEIIDKIKKWKDGNFTEENVSKIIQFCPISREHSPRRHPAFILLEKPL